MTTTTEHRRSERPDNRAGKRFPFTGYPRGWFAVALTDEVVDGAIHRMHYFGQELVAYRGESGRAYVAGAYCPHLGAHLGHGGAVVGETLRCPYHGWRFAGDGRCVEVPYAPKIPPRAKLDAWPTREQNGVIFVFYDADGGDPTELPPLPEEGWTPARSVVWEGLSTHPQEVFENTVDLAHIGPVHDGQAARLLGKPERDGERLDVSLEFDAPGDVVDMPGTLNHVRLDVALRGLGHVVVHTHVTTADVRARQQIYATPIDEASIDLRGLVQVEETDDPVFTQELGEIYYRAYVEDFAKDFPIWENKRYVERPMLAKGDGPIGIFRRYCRDLYPKLTPDVAVDSLRRERRDEEGSLADRALRGAGRLRGLFGRLARKLAPKDAAPETEDDSSFEPVPRPAPAKAKAKAAAPAMPVKDVAQYIETLPERFVPSAARGIDAVFQWELSGAGGATFHAAVKDGTLDVREGSHTEPHVTLKMSAEDYVRVVNGELDGMRAFTSGKGRVSGSVRTAMKMRTLFPQ